MWQSWHVIPWSKAGLSRYWAHTTSRAILISDLNSNIPVVVEPGSFQSILSGTGKYYGKIKYSKDKLELKDNSAVYTSGLGGNFRAGIPVGKINNQIGDFAVQFFSDLTQLSYVKIQSINVLEE